MFRKRQKHLGTEKLKTWRRLLPQRTQRSQRGNGGLWLPCALGLCLGLHLPLAGEIFGHAANHGPLRKCAIPLTRFRFTF